MNEAEFEFQCLCQFVDGSQTRRELFSLFPPVEDQTTNLHKEFLMEKPKRKNTEFQSCGLVNQVSLQSSGNRSSLGIII